MLVWATEFPAAAETRCDDVLSLAKETLITSPHLPWETGDFGDDPVDGLATVRRDGQTVTVGRIESELCRIAGLQHCWTENDEREWITEVVSLTEPNRAPVVSVRLHCTMLQQGIRLPVPKKPYIVRRILETLGGGDDSGLKVQDSPHRLAEPDVELAAGLVRGAKGVTLPVVYVSAGPHRQPYVDVDEISRWLGGMAHVVVEPSRYFSFALARNTGRMNAYGGAVSIYWPNGVAGQVRYLPDQFKDPDRMQKEISDRVRTALTHIRPVSLCTFQYLNELVSRSAIDRLRQEGSTKVEEYMAAFDTELQAKEEKLAAMNTELSRLQAELARQQHTESTLSGVIRCGEEREFYPGEVSDAVIMAIKAGRSSLLEDGRRSHLIDDLLQVNKETDIAAGLRAEIKAIFADTGDLGTAQRRVLQDLGFELSDGGKHWKAVYQGDDRYMFPISKTGSDHRAGKNLASKILRKLLQ